MPQESTASSQQVPYVVKSCRKAEYPTEETGEHLPDPETILDPPEVVRLSHKIQQLGPSLRKVFGSLQIATWFLRYREGHTNWCNGFHWSTVELLFLEKNS